LGSLLGNCFLDRITEFAGLTRFQFLHHEEAAGDLPPGLRSFAVGYRRVTNLTTKERAERTQTLKPNFKTNIRHAQLIATEQLLRFLDATLDQILVRSLIERLPEETQEMITRETGLFGNLVQTQRMVVTVIDKITRTTKPLERLDIR